MEQKQWVGFSFEWQSCVRTKVWIAPDKQYSNWWIHHFSYLNEGCRYHPSAFVLLSLSWSVNNKTYTWLTNSTLIHFKAAHKVGFKTKITLYRTMRGWALTTRRWTERDALHPLTFLRSHTLLPSWWRYYGPSDCSVRLGGLASCCTTVSAGGGRFHWLSSDAEEADRRCPDEPRPQRLLLSWITVIFA